MTSSMALTNQKRDGWEGERGGENTATELMATSK